ncbi:MAG: hypothetical protein ACR2PT_18625 [Endozoicomonas sp.]
MRFFSKQGLYGIFFSILSGCLLASESDVLSDLKENDFAIIPGIRHHSLSALVPVQHVNVLMCHAMSSLKPGQCLQIWITDNEAEGDFSYVAILQVGDTEKSERNVPGESCPHADMKVSKNFVAKPGLPERIGPLGSICRYNEATLFLGSMVINKGGKVQIGDVLVHSVDKPDNYNTNFNSNTSHDCQRILTTDSN